LVVELRDLRKGGHLRKEDTPEGEGDNHHHIRIQLFVGDYSWALKEFVELASD
jgi:hypothetical protein